jgi:hypothetical protein
MDPPGPLIRAINIVSNSVYRTQERFQHAYVVFCQIKYVKCVGTEGGGVGVLARRACGKGVVDSAMDWCGRKFASLHRGLPPPSKGFILLLTATHVLNAYNICCKYFSSAG